MKRCKILLVDESFDFLEQMSADLDADTDVIVATDSIEALQQLCHSPDFDVLVVGKGVRPVKSVTLAQVFCEMTPGGTVYFLLDGDAANQGIRERMSIPGARFVERSSFLSHIAGEISRPGAPQRE